ncbi:MAG: hypothetical protein ABSG51_01180 [Terracidiphilus sp.]|jgi:type II secretory pathway pseudopilin PulG
MTASIPTRRPKPSEEGYMLIAVMFMLAIFTIALAVAVPKMAKQIQRDRELETMHRGKQYVRAIKMYYKKFGAYPPNLDALIQTNQIRFLRKKYVDPTTGKDEWKVIHLGQNKVPTAWGFFGVPLNGPGAGANSQCGSASPSSTTSNSSSSSSPSIFSSTAGNNNCPTDSSSGSTTPTDPNANNGNPASGTGTGLTGQTFGGMGFIGVSPGSPKQSILVLHKKNHYNEWEFVYDPLAEQMTAQGGNLGNNGLTPVGSGSGSGTGGGPGFGGGSGTGLGGTPPPAPPQQ